MTAGSGWVRRPPRNGPRTWAAGPRTARHSYDQADRLTGVEDRTRTGTTLPQAATGTTCVTRRYTFDSDGNRTALDTIDGNSDGTCNTSGGSVTASTYDSADRSSAASGYGYDALGRETTIPAGDTPEGGAAGSLTVAYYDTDNAQSIAQNGTTTTYSLDAAGRRSVATTSAGSSLTLTDHYVDDTDNPGWNQTVSGGTTATTTFTDSINGDLSAQSTGGTLSIDLDDINGDSAATVQLTGASATAISSWTQFTEYGGEEGTGTSAASYGWLAAGQRATDGSGLGLLGARLDDSATGRFTSVDPVVGANGNSNIYPDDPLNEFDPSGLDHHLTINL